MSNHQPNVWQTTGRGGRHAHSTSSASSRTPQNRSGTASPSPSQHQQQQAQAPPAAAAQAPPAKDSRNSPAPRQQQQQQPTVTATAAATQAPNNVWTQRASVSSGSNGPAPRAAENNPASSAPSATASLPSGESISAANFNAGEVVAFLGREATPAVYRLPDTVGSGSEGAGGRAWGGKANHMANNQPFFVQLAKQIAVFEGRG